MNITQSTVQRIYIADAGLDPITVLVEDFAPGKGQITITCFGEAWTAYWGGCGDKGVTAFFCNAYSEYLVDKLIICGCNCEDWQEIQEGKKKYLRRVVKAVQSALREIVGSEKDKS